MFQGNWMCQTQIGMCHKIYQLSIKKVLFSLGFSVKSAMFCWNITNSALSSLSLTSSRFPSYNHILLFFFCKTFPFISMLTLFVYNTGYLSRAVSVSNLICQSVKSSFRKNFIWFPIKRRCDDRCKNFIIYVCSQEHKTIYV